MIANISNEMKNTHKFSGEIQYLKKKPKQKYKNTHRWVEQKQSFFNCLLDMAAMDKTNSRAGSINIETNVDANANASSQTQLLHGQNGQEGERSSLSQLARHSTIRKRSLR